QTLTDLRTAMVEMPRPMRQLAVAMFFQWYAMFAFWQFVVFAIARSLFDTADSSSAAFRQAALVNGQAGAFYNFIAFIAAFAMVRVVRRLGAKSVHALCLVASGAAMISLPAVGSQVALFVPMIGIGLGWASMMGNPYIMLADSIPPARTGIYMGIFNMFIVIPMLIESLTMPLIYRPLLGGDPRNVLIVAGAMMIAAAVATMLVRDARPRVSPLAKAAAN
ncbi:MAG TPA: MFS transporter, partial [Sphingomonas sp.]